MKRIFTFVSLLALAAVFGGNCGGDSEKILANLGEGVQNDWQYDVVFNEPNDGASVIKPVTIVIGATEVDEIILSHKSAGDADYKEIGRETFTGEDVVFRFEEIPTGKHKFLAKGYDADGHEAASDAIEITVIEPGEL